jgi:hypothetical protein
VIGGAFGLVKMPGALGFALAAAVAAGTMFVEAGPLRRASAAARTRRAVPLVRSESEASREPPSPVGQRPEERPPLAANYVDPATGHGHDYGVAPTRPNRRQARRRRRR